MDTILLVVYFVYGMAFLGLGLTLFLEYGRIISIPTRRIFLPLAAFGFLHGIHEWLEAYLILAEGTQFNVSILFAWLRIFLLAISFIFLLIFGIRTFRQPKHHPFPWKVTGIILLFIYMGAIIFSALVSFPLDEIIQVKIFDVLLRYLLAIPGAVLASMAMQFQAALSRSLGKQSLANYMNIASIAFGIYAVSQLFVQPIGFFPAAFLNSESFRSRTGFPVQVLRACMAVAITIAIYKMTNQMETDRRHLLEEAQNQRIEALGKVQEELARKEELRRELLRHIVQAQEEERARVARELHDETGQTLAAISLDLAAMQKLIPNSKECGELNSRLQGHFKEMSQGLYRLVRDLRPAQLDDLGLVPTLQYLVDRVSTDFKLQVQFDTNGYSRRLDPVIETVIFRVAQESLSNVIRHSKTPRALMTLTFGKQEVSLTISDSGVGFNTQKTYEPPQGWGVAGMRERVEAVGGQMIIESSPGNGTTVTVIINVFDLIP